MYTLRRGFTLVELLVVIVVIAILATITIVTYIGVTDRARTDQTAVAASTWLKALQLYKIRNNTLPGAVMNGCLGTGYKYNSDNAGNSGTAQCAQDSGLALTSNSAFSTAMTNYVSGSPSPAFVTAINSTTSWRRGLYYVVTGSLARIELVVDGSQTTATCPALGSTTADIATVYSNGNTVCSYQVGSL